MKESTGNIARETVFEVKNVTSHDKKKVRDISFSVNRGEILGFCRTGRFRAHRADGLPVWG